jgi:nitric oxide reductase NorE protein
MRQLTDRAQIHHGAETGMWLFILADMCIFAMYFFVFAWDKSMHPEQFIQGQSTLNTRLGGANMLILLVSSFFIAKGVHAARKLDITNYLLYIRLTILCGLAFLVVKAIEYSDKFSAGYYIASNEFYRDYFAFTGLHMLHVITGLCVLVYALQFGQSGTPIKNNARFIENSGVYWHMVDLLWVVLFAYIYLVP